MSSRFDQEATGNKQFALRKKESSELSRNCSRPLKMQISFKEQLLQVVLSKGTLRDMLAS